MKHRLFFLLFGTLILGALASCESTTGVNPTPPALDTTTIHDGNHAVFVLNEGVFNHTNSSLDAIIFRTAGSADQVVRHNILTHMGEGNDIVVSNDRIYVLDNAGNQLFVVDASSFKTLSTIRFGSDGPNKMALIGSNQLIVTRRNSNSAAIVDLVKNAITDSIPLGEGSIAVAVLNNVAFISSGSYALPGRVHVIDLSSRHETTALTLLTGPERMVADGASNQVVVGCLGAYDSVGPKVYWINPSTATITASADAGGKQSTLTLTTGGKTSLILDGVLTSLDMSAHAVGGPIGTGKGYYYEGAYDPSMSQYFLGVSDFVSAGGRVDAYDGATNTLRFSDSTGIAPAHFAFYH